MSDPAPAAAPGQARRRGLCLVIAAPSGAGKSSVANALRAADGNLMDSVSVTTRKPRPGEVDGIHYHFRDEDAFHQLAAGGELVEWAEVFGRFYGTPRSPVITALEGGRDVVFDIDWQGHRQLRAALPGDVVSLFILPPDLRALAERLRERGQDDETEIGRRMDAAREECAHWPEFDHVLVNETLDVAVAEARAVLVAARLATRRQGARAAAIAGSPPSSPTGHPST